MIHAEDLCAIDAFNDQQLRVVFDEAYKKVFHHLGGDGFVSAELIIHLFTEQTVLRIREMAIDAIEGLTE